MNVIRWHFPLTSILLLGTMAGLKWNEQPRPEALMRPLDTIAPEIAGWTMSGSYRLSDSVAGVLDATTYVSQQYRKNAQSLTLFVAYYAEQRAGETMHSPRNCLPGEGWEIWQRERAPILFKGKPATINKFSIQNAGQHLLVYYWYQSRRNVVADEYLGKFILLRDALMQGGTAGSIVRVIVPDTPGLTKDGLAFAAAVERQFEMCLGS
jgi:EpsI family protein